MDNCTAGNYNEQAAFFAHEIKNPLAVIKANVQLIELEKDGIDEKRFKTIYECIERINSLIADNTAKIKAVDKSDKNDAVSVMKKVIDKYEKSFDRKFGFKCEINKAPVKCSDELLESLFENIIKNAVEATNNGDSINTEIKIKRGKVSVSVADEGCGISDKDIAGMGELFYTTKKGGSGIGLFMCRRIAEQNGGRIKITHNKPKGTIVTVELNQK